MPLPVATRRPSGSRTSQLEKKIVCPPPVRLAVAVGRELPAPSCLRHRRRRARPAAPGHRLGRRQLLSPRRALDLPAHGPDVPHAHRCARLGGEREPGFSAGRARVSVDKDLLRQGHQPPQPALVPPGDHHHLHADRRPVPDGAVHGPGPTPGPGFRRQDHGGHRRHRLRAADVLPGPAPVRAWRRFAGFHAAGPQRHQYPGHALLSA